MCFVCSENSNKFHHRSKICHVNSRKSSGSGSGSGSGRGRGRGGGGGGGSRKTIKILVTVKVDVMGPEFRVED